MIVKTCIVYVENSLKRAKTSNTRFWLCHLSRLRASVLYTYKILTKLDFQFSVKWKWFAALVCLHVCVYLFVQCLK